MSWMHHCLRPNTGAGFIWSRITTTMCERDQLSIARSKKLVKVNSKKAMGVKHRPGAHAVEPPCRPARNRIYLSNQNKDIIKSSL